MRCCHSVIQCLKNQGEADEAGAEAREAEEKAKKFMLDAAKLAEELRAEQENAQVSSELNRRMLR
jgi:hypothetical protein